MSDDLSIYLTVILTFVFGYGVWVERRAFRLGMFPFISFVAAYYLLFHGFFSLYAAKMEKYASHDVFLSLEALFFVAAFAVVHISVFHLAMRFDPMNDKRIAAIVPNATPNAAKILAWSAVVFSLMFDLVPILNVLPSLPQLKQPLWHFAVAALAIQFFTGQLSRVEIIGLATAIPLKFYFEFNTALFTNTVFTIVLFLCAAIYCQRFREAMGIAMVCILAISAYAYPKYFAREYALDIPSGIYKFKPELSTESLVTSIGSVARRSSHSLLTSHVMARTPEQIPYSERSPLIDTLTNHVPRIIWREKPKEVYGNAFGKRYGIVNQNDELTSWNLPWTVDLYITGGATSALLRLALISALLFALVRWLSLFPDRTFGFGLHAATVFPLFHQSSNVSLMAGNIITVTLFMLLSYFLVSKALVLARRD